jgi:predicted ATPase/DNA-binding CsgD family transcriptional regulator
MSQTRNVGPGRLTNLPLELSAFIGREVDQARVQELIAAHRLVTLTGIGGVGKTRLALRVARDVSPLFIGGAWLIELAPVRDPGLVCTTIAATLGVREQPGRPLLETLIAAIRQRQPLLVLDNAEHLLVACAELVRTLLEQCQPLKILATSRAPLGVPGEQVWIVPPLQVSAGPGTETPLVMQSEPEAVQLFFERARSVQGRFTATPGNSAAVRLIVSRLEGLPLAIELAAARVRVLAPEQIAARLDDRLSLLAATSSAIPARHRSLRASLEWSHDLLSEPEKRLFETLAVFAGGASLEAIEAVATVSGEECTSVLELLTGLVNSSQIHVDFATEAQGRYTMLETVREFGLERLAAGGREQEIRQRHAAYFIALAESAQPQLLGPRALELIGRLELEHANLRGAWRWAVDTGNADLQLRIAASTWEFRWLRGYVTEALDTVQTALAGGDHAVCVPHAEALFGAGMLLAMQGQRAAALESFLMGADEFRALSHDRGVVRALASAGILHVLLDKDYTAAETLLHQARLIAQEANDMLMTGYCQFGLGQAALARNECAQAVALLEDSLSLFRHEQSPLLSAHALDQLVFALDSMGQRARARAVAREGLALTIDLHDTWGMLFTLTGLAATSVDEPERAARLLGISECLRLSTGFTIPRTIADARERAETMLHSSLGRLEFDRLFEVGRCLPLQDGLTYALGSDATASESRQGQAPEGVFDVQASALSAREREVLMLLARGYSNQQIADELIIGVRTVETHVARVIRKLDVKNRAQAMLWAREHGLVVEHQSAM